ncbi:hypothetical protein LZD49_35325, partial [Dyadobacter sp. CY261]
MDRLNGAKLQGSNNGGSSWTDIYTFSANGTGSYQEFTFSNSTTYSSLRFVASSTGWGELTELEFYNGTTKLTGAAFGTGNYGLAFDNSLSTKWEGSSVGSSNVAGLNLNSCGDPVLNPPTISRTSGTTACVASNQKVVLTASNCSGSITWFRSGTQVGTGVTLETNAPGNYTARCTVGSQTSESAVFNVAETSGCGVVGNCLVNKVKLVFRTPGDCCMDRLNGAKLQGSNNGGSSWTDIYTFSANGTGSYQEFTFSNSTTYSSLRFVASSTGWGELTELEFYNGTTKLTGTAFGTGNYGLAFDNSLSTKWEGSSVGSSNVAGLNLNSCGDPVLNPPTISRTSGTTACVASNQKVVLTASNCSGSITWFRGTTQVGTGVTLETNVPGNYTAKCTVGSQTSESTVFNVGETSGCGVVGNCLVNKVKLVFRSPSDC